MKLIVISSSSVGNSYALDAGSEILLLEAGIRHPLVSRSIGFRDDKVVGCLLTHHHSDHAKYAEEYAKRGVKVYCNEDIADKKKFPYGSFKVIKDSTMLHIGTFVVIPFKVNHSNNDGSPCPSFGYIINHKDAGNIFFSLDTYKFGAAITGIDHFIIEANYDDRILKNNVQDGKIDRHQANRLMLSHMEVNNTIHYLEECHADTASTITLCHLSERNSNPDDFRLRVSSRFGVPTYIAQKGLVVELSKEII